MENNFRSNLTLSTFIILSRASCSSRTSSITAPVYNNQKYVLQEDLSLSNVARSRLAYDELLASQLVLAMRRKQARGVERAAPAKAAMDDGNGSRVAVSIGDSGDSLVEEGMRRLPFQLTQNQQECEQMYESRPYGSGGKHVGRRGEERGEVCRARKAFFIFSLVRSILRWYFLRWRNAGVRLTRQVET